MMVFLYIFPNLEFKAINNASGGDNWIEITSSSQYKSIVSYSMNYDTEDMSVTISKDLLIELTLYDSSVEASGTVGTFIQRQVIPKISYTYYNVNNRRGLIGMPSATNPASSNNNFSIIVGSFDPVNQYVYYRVVEITTGSVSITGHEVIYRTQWYSDSGNRFKIYYKN